MSRQKKERRSLGEGLYLNTAGCRVMDHCQRAARRIQRRPRRDSLRRSLECTSESYLVVIAITTCRERTSLASSSFYAARARLRELFAVKLRCSPCRRLVSNENFSYVDFGSSLRGEVMSRCFNSS